MNDVLYPAKKGKYAVGLFNAVNLELARGIIAAAENSQSPVIMGTAEVLLPYGPLEEVSYYLIPMAKKANVPVVLVDRSFQDEEYDCVEVDNRTAIYRATNKLIENHHKKIAVIASNIEYTGRERVKGYSDAMNQAGLEIPKEYCKLGGHSFEHGYRGMKELLELEDRPTGVILGNYNTMLGGIMALNESGLSCPQDVSLIGVDNLPMTQVLRPKLWLIVQPMETMCEKAVAMLLERVNGEQNGMPVKISFSTSVREGDSIRDLG